MKFLVKINQMIKNIIFVSIVMLIVINFVEIISCDHIKNVTGDLDLSKMDSFNYDSNHKLTTEFSFVRKEREAKDEGSDGELGVPLGLLTGVGGALK